MRGDKVENKEAKNKRKRNKKIIREKLIYWTIKLKKDKKEKK